MLLCRIWNYAKLQEPCRHRISLLTNATEKHLFLIFGYFWKKGRKRESNLIEQQALEVTNKNLVLKFGAGWLAYGFVLARNFDDKVAFVITFFNI